jgi:hypothetical protein
MLVSFWPKAYCGFVGIGNAQSDRRYPASKVSLGSVFCIQFAAALGNAFHQVIKRRVIFKSAKILPHRMFFQRSLVLNFDRDDLAVRQPLRQRLFGFY